MRTLLLFLLSGFLTSTAWGQVTLTSEDFAKKNMHYPVAIDTFSADEAEKTQEYLQKPWELTELAPDEKDTLNFISTDNAPHADLFSQANLATNAIGMGYAYLHKSDEELRLHGLVSDLIASDTVLQYRFENPLLLLNFPSEKGDAYSSQSSGSIADTPEALGIPEDSIPSEFNPDSLRLQLELQFNNEFNASGELTTPAGTQKALLQKSEQLFTVKVFVYISTFLYEGWVAEPVFTRKDTTYMYSWHGKGMGVPLATLTVADNKVESIQYQPDFPLSVNANLAGLRINGKVAEGFKANRTKYKVKVDYTTTKVPEVSATPADAASEVEIEPATSLEGSEEERTTDIIITSASGHTKTYRVIFSYEEPSDNAKLAAIVVNNDTIQGFAPEIYHYSYNANAFNRVPDINAIPEDTAAQVDIQPATSLTGDSASRSTRIQVTAEDGSSNTYTVVFLQTTSLSFADGKHIRLYPNPAGRQVVIENRGDGMQFKLHDIHGRLVKNKVLHHSKNTVHVDDLTAGIYAYTFITEDGTVYSQGKLMIK